MSARKILAGWRAAWRDRRHAAVWPEDEVTADEYVAELTGEHPVIPAAAPARPQRHVPRHRRTGPPAGAIMTVSVHDLRYGPWLLGAPAWDQPTGLPPAGGPAIGQLVRTPPPAPVPDEPLAAPPAEASRGDGERQGPPTVVFEVVRPNIAAEIDPYLASLPGYSEDPDAI